MLFRMYQSWAERRGFALEVIDYTEGEEAGIKGATFTASGEYAFGLLSAERGMHRLVRISPFDAGARRHTSFASVSVSPVVGDAVEVEIDEQDLKVEARADSTVEIEYVPSGIAVGSNQGPGQRENREAARQVLRSRLFEMGREKEQTKRGAQRTYVLHPYKLVKVRYTGVETANVDRVLDGDLDPFLGGG